MSFYVGKRDVPSKNIIKDLFPFMRKSLYVSQFMHSQKMMKMLRLKRQINRSGISFSSNYDVVCGIK